MANRQSFGRFCLAWPPPFLIGLRMPPVRALPVPFWRNILRVEPATSPRARVRTLPWRLLARYMTIACLRRLLRTSPPSLASSTWIVSTLLPAWLNTGTSIMVLSVVRSPLSVVQSLRRQTTGRLCLFANLGGDALADEQQRAVRTRQGTLDQEQVLLGVDLDQRVVAGRD